MPHERRRYIKLKKQFSPGAFHGILGVLALLISGTFFISSAIAEISGNMGAEKKIQEAKRRYADLVRLLLKKGADPKAKCKDGSTPLKHTRDPVLRKFLSERAEGRKILLDSGAIICSGAGPVSLSPFRDFFSRPESFFPLPRKAGSNTQ